MIRKELHNIVRAKMSLLGIGICACLLSCQDFSDDTGTTVLPSDLYFEEQQLEISFEEEEYNIPIESTHPWRVKTNAEWIDLVVPNGMGSGSYKMKIERNTDLLPREAEMIAWVIEGKEIKQKIVQEGIGIAFKKNVLTLFSEAQTVRVPFVALVNYTWTLSDGCDWITVKNTPSATPNEMKEQELVLNIKEFTGEGKRTASLFLNGANGAIIPLSITQTKQLEGWEDIDYLRMFYEGANGASWVKKWNFEAPLQTDTKNWPGVTVTNGRVTGIEFVTENNIVGELTPLCYLSELAVLKLKRQKIASIPQEIGKLKKLTNLWVVECAATGTIPEEIAECGNLAELNLSNHPTATPAGFENSFAGEIGILLNNSNLRTIKIYHNAFTGPIPVLPLNSDNQPEAWPNLKEFYVYDNSFTGSIPIGYGYLFSKNSTTVNVTNCGLSGKVPDDLKSWAYYQTNKDARFLSGNNLTE